MRNAIQAAEMELALTRQPCMFSPVKMDVLAMLLKLRTSLPEQSEGWWMIVRVYARIVEER